MLSTPETSVHVHVKGVIGILPITQYAPDELVALNHDIAPLKAVAKSIEETEACRCVGCSYSLAPEPDSSVRYNMHQFSTTGTVTLFTSRKV